MATSLPLPKGFFGANNLRLTEERRRQYIEYAESSIRKVFALSDCHRNSWIPVREKKGVAVFRNFGMSRGPSAYKSNIAEVGGKGDVQASLDEIARAYAAHDDALFSRLMKKLNAGVLDAAVICTIVPRSPLAPFRYIGIKWFAVKTPTPLVSHRDYCVLEVQDKIVDAFGNEMYIRLLNSIDINECPSLENSHGLVRAKMLAGFMYRSDRAEPHVVRIHHVARFDPAGYFPSQWAYKTAESQLVSSIVQIKRVVEKQQMNACTFVDKKQWVPNHERAHCAVCSRPFGTFRPRHHCRCCGEVICGKCSVFKSVDVPGTTLKNVRLCSICNMGVTKTRPNGNGHGSGAASSGDDAMSDISTSSVTSSSTLAYNEMNLMDLYLSANGTNPNTPSAYSTASGQSNLSMRSTASSRSVMDARHRAATTAGTPGTARFFKGGGGPGQSIFSSSSRVNTSANSSAATTPARTRSDSRSLFNETNTPRSYIGGSATPRSAYHHQQQQHQQHQQIFFGGAPSSNAVQTPRALGAGLAAGDAASGDETPSAHEHRKSIFKQNPLDLGYLRDSVRMTTTATATTPVTTTTTVTTVPAAATTTSIPPTVVSTDTIVAVGGLATVASTQPAQASTTPTRARGESSAELLPPAKIAKLVQDQPQHAVHEEQDDVEMEEAQQQEDQDHTSTTTTEPMALTDLAMTFAEPTKDEPPTYEELFVRGAAHSSTSTTESSVAADAAPVQPVSSMSSPPASTPRKSFLGSLFSRSSLEAKPPAA